MKKRAEPQKQNRNSMTTTTTLLQQQQQQQQFQQQEHTIELMCRICAVDFKIATEGVSIFNTEQLMDKIKNYLHIQVNNLDKLSHLVCNECVRKIESFHCYALMAQKNQELFNIMYSEKIYREHCTALSSLNTTLYREPPTPQIQQVQTKPQPTITVQSAPPLKKPKLQSPKQQTTVSMIPPQPTVLTSPLSQAQQLSQVQPQSSSQQPVAVLSTEDITIFTYQDLKLGQVIKDQELQKLILRALKWTDAGKTIEQQLDRLKNASFRAVLNNPDLLRDEDLVQLLGPYLDHGSFAPLDTTKTAGPEFNAKLMDQNVTEMEVGVDPDLFFPYDDDESKSMDVEVTKVTSKPKKERKKSESKSKASNKKTSTIGSTSVITSVAQSQSVQLASQPQPQQPTQSTPAPTNISPGKIRVKPEAQLFNVAAMSQTTITPEKVMPKPIIVIPKPPKPIIKQNLPAQPKIKESDEVPSAVQITPEPMPLPKIAQASKPIVETPPIIKVPVISKPDVTIELEPPPKKTEVKVSTPQNVTSTTTSVIASTSAVTSTTVTTTTKSVSRASATKHEPKSSSRQQRKVKIDEKAGPKTRARSVFGARHKCAVCAKKFSTSGNLKAHVKTHKPKGKFNCEKCGRVFKTQLNLTRHKDYHAGERYSCRTCGRVYPSNSTLKQHEIAHSNVRPHKCNICMKTFKRSQDLKFHTNQHTGEKPYKCPFCPKAFASSGNCFSHRKRVHSDKSINLPTPTASKRTSSLETSNSKKLVKA